jgi:hypothetical protein
MSSASFFCRDLRVRVQGWDALIGHTPETVAKTGKGMVAATLVIALVAATVELD